MWPFKAKINVPDLERRADCAGLVAALRDTMAGPAAAEALGRLPGEQVDEALIRALEAGVPLAARALGRRGGSAARAPIEAALVKGLGAEDLILHQECRAALVAMGATGALTEALRHHPSPSARRLALRALIELRPADLPELLREALHGEDRDLRTLALAFGATPAAGGGARTPDEVEALGNGPATAIAELAAREAIPALRRALVAGEPEAARALGRLRAVEAREELVAALDDPRIGGVAAEALGELGDPASIPALLAWAERTPRVVGPDGDPEPAAFALDAAAKLQRLARR